MNMKKDQLKKFVKQIVRESLSDREYKRILNEVSPPGKKAGRMVQHVKTSLRKAHPDWNEDKITSVAIATGWKNLNENFEEGADSRITPLDDITRLVMGKGVTDPQKVEYLVVNLYKHQMGTTPDTDAVKSAIERNGPPQRRGGSGDLDIGPLEEESYKVVSPNETDTADEDKARTIQTDPKVNEGGNLVHAPIGKLKKPDADYISPKRPYDSQPWDVPKPRYGNKKPTAHPDKVDETAYKTQGPSYKTFEDSPQLPDAVNDPENA